MVFLNPSILLGLLAASIPIIIHILNFRKLQKVEFSTLAFLKELQKSKIKKIKIKQWILLLLRTLIIVFLVLAFARPTLDNVSLLSNNSSAKTSSVFIIDNSFSMGYVGDDGSIFNNSKKLAKSIVSNMEDGDEFMFMSSMDSITTTTSKESAIKMIDELELNLKLDFSTENLLGSKTILENSQNINKEIFLFSDFQSSTFQNQIDTLKLVNNEDNIALYSFDMSIESPSNYAISNLRLKNTILEVNKPLSFSAIANNYSEDTGVNLTASLFLNNKRVAQQNIIFSDNKEEHVNFETSLSSTGLIEARAIIEEDNISQDNVAYLNFLIPKKNDVLIVYDNPQDISFLEAALKSSSESEQITVHKLRGTNLSNQQLEEYKIIFLVSSKINSQINFDNYLSKGGSLIFIPPSSINKNEIEDLTSKFNFLNDAEIITTSGNANNYLDFGSIDYKHPIFKNLFENNAKNEIESPNIFKSIKFRNNSLVQPVISLIDKSIFLGEYKGESGSIMFFNSALTLDWSNFPIKGIFAPIISRIVYYLSSTNKKTNTYFVGDEIGIDISQVTYPIIDVSLPVGDAKINLDSYTNNVYPFTGYANSGSYKFYNDNELLSFASVNVDPKESNLTKIENEQLTNIYQKLFGANYLLVDQNENYIETISQARYGTELWKLLLTIALILALIEMYIARSTKKDIARLN